MTKRLSVTVFPNGPYKISGVTQARYCGVPMDVDGDVFLCRCGQSANAPFCDGTHKGAFDDTNPEPLEQKIRVWEGETIRTFFNSTTCMHVFYCKPLKELRERELAGDAAAATEIMRVVKTCPSGALSYELKDEAVATPQAEDAACIDIAEGGKIRLQVPFDIDQPLHERQADDRATLCRCGMSKNKPWCDGRHKKRDDGFR